MHTPLCRSKPWCMVLVSDSPVHWQVVETWDVVGSYSLGLNLAFFSSKCSQILCPITFIQFKVGTTCACFSGCLASFQFGCHSMLCFGFTYRLLVVTCVGCLAYSLNALEVKTDVYVSLSLLKKSKREVLWNLEWRRMIHTETCMFINWHRDYSVSLVKLDWTEVPIFHLKCLSQ